MKKVFVTLLAVSFACFIYGQSQQFIEEELSEDLNSLIYILENTHPDIYFDITRDEFKKKVDDAKSKLNSGMDVFDFYKTICPVVVALNDGHTALGYPFTQFRSVESQVFPVRVNVNTQDGSITVKEAYSSNGNQIPKNAKLTSINGTPIKNVVNEMLAYMPGERTFYRLSSLTAYFIPLMYVLDRKDTYIIEYEYQKTLDTIGVEALSFDMVYNSTDTKEDYPDYSFSVKDSIAVIDFRSFRDLKSFRDFLKTTFTTIRDQNIGDLIIDLRENGGGSSSLGNELFQYIADKPFHQFERATIRKRNGKLKKIEDVKLIKPKNKKLKFEGNIYVLQSNRTFSSAAAFTWAFSYFEFGKIIGEETGGMSVTHGRTTAPIRLPNTGLKAYVSSRKFIQIGASESDIHGTYPDYRVPAEEAMNFAIELIKKDQKN